MNLTENELEALVQVGQTTQVVEVRMNLVHIIGDITVMLSKSLQETGCADVFKVLVGWLVDGGCKDPDLRVVAESLDKLFDAFSEDDTDCLLPSKLVGAFARPCTLHTHQAQPAETPFVRRESRLSGDGPIESPAVHQVQGETTEKLNPTETRSKFGAVTSPDIDVLSLYPTTYLV